MQRVQHWLLFISFTTLGLTGLIQKFISADISIWLIQALGGIEAVRIIHRAAAILFGLDTIYHVIELGYKIYVERGELTMLPGLKDMKDAIQAFGYNLGFSKTPPKMGRYTFAEKAEYWALMWGGLVMGLTGFMLWNPIATAKILPGVFIPAAKAAHGAEAILAVVAILIWHVYHVHIKHWNPSMFHGKISHVEMEEEHPLELDKIRAGVGKPLPEQKVLAKRKSIFIPSATILTAVLLVGLYYIITFEDSAITTLPPAERVTILSTRVPTLVPTEAPALPPGRNMNPDKPVAADGALTWNGVIGTLVKDKCAMCHGSSGGYSVGTYTDFVKGGISGTGITPENPDSGTVITIQKTGNHPGQFSEDELVLIQEWITAGAPEN
jgi:cytochrome b subunit of formate dehydrogenase